METLIADIRHALRVLRQSPGFALTAITVLALGIGASTAIFSVVNAVLLEPLPFPDSGRVVLLMNSSPQGNFPAASVPKYNVWRRQTQVLSDIAAYDTGGPGINLSGDRPEQVKGIHASYEFFHLFGIRTLLGRTFTPQEDRPGGGKLAVLSEGLWQRRYGSDPAIVGKALDLGGEPYTVIGVVASSFVIDPAPDLYLPFQADPDSTNQGHYFQSAARLKPGVSLGAAKAALNLAGGEFRRLFPKAIGPKDSFTVDLMRDDMVRGVKTALYVLLGAVGCLLLIACANVASLLLARATGRSREIAIRAAIGAGRGRIVRQLLTESVLLAAVGGALGLALGVVGVRLLLAVNPGNIPRLGPAGTGVPLDIRVLLFTMLLSILTGVFFGLVPALHASRVDLNSTLKEGSSRSGSGLRQNKSRGALVVVELALAVVLLVGAGLLIRTFAALRTVAPGFDTHNVLTMETALTGGKYDKTAGITLMADQVLERIQAVPGVEAAAASSYLPLDGGLGLGFSVEGRPATDSQGQGGGAWNYVTARFFDCFKIPLVRGRVFTLRDDAASAPVVIVNEALVRRFFKSQDPIGQRLIIGAGMGPNFAQPPREIVGVIGDARDGGLNNDPGPAMFVPLAQVGDAYMALNNTFMPLDWVVRTHVAPYSVLGQLQSAFQTAAGLPVFHVRSMDQIVSGSTARDQFNTLLLGIFAFFAILLASIGLYGLMAYSVEQRRLEFGIRLALGANYGQLQRMVVRQAMLLAVAGILIGLGGALGLTRFLRPLLFQVKTTDPAIFVAVPLVLAMVALIACYIPSRRATRVDPVEALRYQ
ncbi:MAG TPA: ABC transporter permease [Bryobacteraceae bacterium]|nr:ABC transporter permease [Bryobacteraceae bacterium]